MNRSLWYIWVSPFLNHHPKGYSLIIQDCKAGVIVCSRVRLWMLRWEQELAPLLALLFSFKRQPTGGITQEEEAQVFIIFQPEEVQAQSFFITSASTTRAVVTLAAVLASVFLHECQDPTETQQPLFPSGRPATLRDLGSDSWVGQKCKAP